MRISKRNEYEKTMDLVGIDTLSGYLPAMIDEIPSDIKRNITQCNYRKNEERTYILINPNKKSDGTEKLIESYSEFVAVMDEIMRKLGCDLDDLDVARADFCFNSKKIESYEDYKKLHRLLLSCLASAYKFKNCYVSCDLWDYGALSIAIKKDDSEAENYNKYRQSDGKDESANRLELRSKRMSGSTIEEQFVIKWFERLDQAAQEFAEVQKKCNEHLAELYKNDLQRLPKVRIYAGLNAFILQYRDSIYTRNQLRDLFGRFDEVKNVESRTKKFLEKHRIEFFSQKDLEHMTDVLKRKTIEYFTS